MLGLALAHSVENLVVTHGFQTQLPVRGSGRRGVGADQGEQLDARALAEFKPLCALAKQYDRALELLLGAGDLGGQLGRGLLVLGLARRFVFLRHAGSFCCAWIGMQVAPRRGGAFGRSASLQMAATQAANAARSVLKRSPRAAKQFGDRTLRRGDRAFFEVKSRRFYGSCADCVEFHRTAALHRHRVPEGRGLTTRHGARHPL